MNKYIKETIITEKNVLSIQVLFGKTKPYYLFV